MDTEMQAFVKVIDKGSFASAAAELHLTSSAMSKLITRLEDRLGTRLIHRTTRRLALTPEGETFLQRARAIVEAIVEAEAEVSNAGMRPQGRLRVNCTSGFFSHQLSRVLPHFLAKYPDIKMELSVTDRVVNLLAESADVGLRSGTVVEPTLVVRKIATFERRLYASPDYLTTHGVPNHPDDLLSNHSCIVHSTHTSPQWPFLIAGRRHELAIPTQLQVDNADAALHVALAGGGITRIADMMAENDVRAGRLAPVLTQYHFHEPIVFSAVYPHGKHRMPKVRAFLDFVVTQFQRPSWADLPMQ